MAVILGGVLLSMVARREDSHLMSVDGVVVEEMAGLLVDFARAVLIAPQVKQLLVHRVRAELGYLPQVTEHSQLGVRNAHVGLVRLDVILGDRLEFGCGCRVDEFLEDGKTEAFAGPGYELFEVDFADGANGVELFGWVRGNREYVGR